MRAHHFRTINRIFSNNWRATVLPAALAATLFATITIGCRSVVESNGIPSTLTLTVDTSVIAVGGESIQLEARLLNTVDRPVAGIDVVFEADSGTFTPGAVVATNDMGIAAVTLTSASGSIRASALNGEDRKH